MTTRASLSSPRSSLADRTGSAKVRGVVRAAVAVAMAWATVGGVLPARAADLTLDEGVVVKFGAGAQLVVRDRLVTQSGVILTSQNDDGVLGPSFAQARLRLPPISIAMAPPGYSAASAVRPMRRA